MLNRASYLISFALLASSPAQAEVDWVSLIWHNDLFAHQDGGGYTNGAYISWYDVSDLGQTTDIKAPLLTRSLMWMIDEDPQFSFSAYTIGQAMITPKDISQTNPNPSDAPYAGLLFLRSSYIAVHEHYADTISTTIGILGPDSGAEGTQKFIHKITESTEPKGWDSQLENEPVGQISRARVWRLYNDKHPNIDVLTLANGSLGNLESSLGTGLLLRFGTGLEKSFSTAALLTGRTSNPIAVDGGWYTYFGVTADYVHNQIFVNGNTFRDSPSANLKHEQYNFIAGLSYSWTDVSISLAYQIGTPLDLNTSARQKFGALTLAWRL